MPTREQPRDHVDEEFTELGSGLARFLWEADPDTPMGDILEKWRNADPNVRSPGHGDRDE